MCSIVCRCIWLILLRTLFLHQNEALPRRTLKNLPSRRKPTGSSFYILTTCTFNNFRVYVGPRAGGPVWVGALQRLCSSGLYVSRGSRVSGGHFCLFTFFSFVPCYNNCSKIAFKFAQIYNYLVWTVTFEVTALKRKTGRGD